MSRQKRNKREIDYEEEEEDVEKLPYFVPEGGIDIEILALYTRSILDQDAKVKLGNHPQRKDEKGFWIYSSVPVSREDIQAMIEDTRSWGKERDKGHYVNSRTARRRLQIGRAEQGRDRASMAQPRVAREVREPEEPRISSRQPTRMSTEPDPRYQPAPAITRSSTDNISMPEYDRRLGPTSPSPRPASAQAASLDPRRPSTGGYGSGPNPGYVQTTAQYTVQANVPATAQYAQYQTLPAFDSAPPQYQDDDKRYTPLSAPSDAGHPSTTGTPGFSMYATAGPTKPRAPANQGQRRQQ